MRGAHRRQVIELGLTAAAGISLGVALAGSGRVDPLSVFVFLAMACLAEWLDVRPGPLARFTLRPVVAFVGLWSGGPALLLLAGLLPVLLVGVALKRASLRQVLPTAGRDALGFWLGYLVYQGLAGYPAWPWDAGVIGQAAARAVSFGTFWVAHVHLQALDLNLSEGVRFPSALHHLMRLTWTHAGILILVAVVLGYLEAGFGLIATGIAVVMLVEAYYPWKLLGEQDGVLLTSLQMMAQAVDLKDPYTSNHSQRVSQYAVRLARAMGLPEREVERIRIGGLMHDLGKIGVSGRIIRKPAKLTAEEQALMREHASVSASIIEPLEILGESAAMVRHHHENWDGSGYPDGLRGEEIPLGARIIFVADALDALLTDRPYRKGASRAEALAIIRQNAGTQFDPTVVAALERVSPLL